VTLNYSRVHRTRPGYGYARVPDPWADQPAPAEDGIYLLDLDTGSSRLIVSLDQVAQLAPTEDMEGAEHWFNHLQFSPLGRRFIFLHRWRAGGGGWRTRLYTADADGGQIVLLGREGMVSHFDWRDDEHILAWSRHGGQDGYHLYRDRSDEVQVVGAEVLDCDGHCSYSPDRRWILTDTYPDRERSERTLILYHPETGARVDVGRFYSAPEIGGEIRCDLHPRWSRDGRQVCIDSIHEGERQMYVVDVSSVVG
jgi:Tol biopolymer transport system component